jgi:hypothetical protein
MTSHCQLEIQRLHRKLVYQVLRKQPPKLVYIEFQEGIDLPFTNTLRIAIGMGKSLKHLSAADFTTDPRLTPEAFPGPRPPSMLHALFLKMIISSGNLNSPCVLYQFNVYAQCAFLSNRLTIS